MNSGVIGGLGADAALSPSALVATTEQLYSTSFVREDTVIGEVLLVPMNVLVTSVHAAVKEVIPKPPCG